jgi:Tol biopolymer transport system component
MMRRIATVLAVAALVPGGVAFAATPQTSLVSVTVDGAPAAGTSGRPSVSTDGRYVAFASTAPNLVRGDNNGVSDVFVRDRQTGVTTRVSVSSAGVEANGVSGNPSISGDGRYVVFESRATNLITVNPGGFQNIYERDLVTGRTQRINCSDSQFTQPDGDSADPVISADGQHVAFDSVAGNLGGADTNGVSDVFRWDRHDWGFSSPTMISRNQFFYQGDGPSWGPSISADGSVVAYTSDATDLDVRADSNNSSDVFVYDGRTTLVSRGFDGKLGNGASRDATLSADGKHIVYESYATNLVPDDTNGRPDLFTARIRYWDTNSRVNVDPAGAVAGGAIGPRASISADGRYVAFSSGEDGLAANDINGTWDVLVRDTVAGATSLVSTTSGGTPGDNFSDEPSISTDGQHVAFKSQASNFVPGVPAGSANTYVRDLVS